jgi:hypothetical protein
VISKISVLPPIFDTAMPTSVRVLLFFTLVLAACAPVRPAASLPDADEEYDEARQAPLPPEYDAETDSTRFYFGSVDVRDRLNEAISGSLRASYGCPGDARPLGGCIPDVFEIQLTTSSDAFCSRTASPWRS